MGPFRAAADAARLYFQNPLNPLSQTPFGRSMAAAAELFERTTRRYGKPEWGLAETTLRGVRVPVTERIVWERPFGRIIHFEKAAPKNIAADLARHLLSICFLRRKLNVKHDSSRRVKPDLSDSIPSLTLRKR